MTTMTLYIKACAGCGKDKALVSKLQRYAYGAPGVTLRIKDSRYNEDNRANHLRAIGLLGLKSDSYPSVVEFTGDGLPENTVALYQTLEEAVRQLP
jgi:hypothetical protein